MSPFIYVCYCVGSVPINKCDAIARSAKGHAAISFALNLHEKLNKVNGYDRSKTCRRQIDA